MSNGVMRLFLMFVSLCSAYLSEAQEGIRQRGGNFIQLAQNYVSSFTSVMVSMRVAVIQMLPVILERVEENQIPWFMYAGG